MIYTIKTKAKVEMTLENCDAVYEVEAKNAKKAKTMVALDDGEEHVSLKSLSFKGREVEMSLVGYIEPNLNSEDTVVIWDKEKEKEEARQKIVQACRSILTEELADLRPDIEEAITNAFDSFSIPDTTTKKCEWCEKEFVPKVNKQKFCCNRCRWHYNDTRRREKRKKRK